VTFKNIIGIPREVTKATSSENVKKNVSNGYTSTA